MFYFSAKREPFCRPTLPLDSKQISRVIFNSYITKEYPEFSFALDLISSMKVQPLEMLVTYGDGHSRRHGHWRNVGFVNFVLIRKLYINLTFFHERRQRYSEYVIYIRFCMFRIIPAVCCILILSVEKRLMEFVMYSTLSTVKNIFLSMLRRVRSPFFQRNSTIFITIKYDKEKYAGWKL